MPCWLASAMWPRRPRRSWVPTPRSSRLWTGPSNCSLATNGPDESWCYDVVEFWGTEIGLIASFCEASRDQSWWLLIYSPRGQSLFRSLFRMERWTVQGLKQSRISNIPCLQTRHDVPRNVFHTIDCLLQYSPLIREKVQLSWNRGICALSLVYHLVCWILVAKGQGYQEHMTWSWLARVKRKNFSSEPSFGKSFESLKGWFSSALFLFQVAAGEVEIQGGIYDLETGHVEFLGQSPAQNILMKSGATFPAVLRPVQHQASVPQVAPAQVLAAPVQYRAQRFTYVLPATTRVVQAPAAPAYLQPAQAAPVTLVQTTWHGVQGNRFIWADRLARGKFCNFTQC